MGTKVYNRKTKQAANCERPDWTTCRDHHPGKGWSVYPAGKTLTFKNGHLDSETENNNAVSFEDYEQSSNVSQTMSPEYLVRAQKMEEKNLKDIRELGIGTNFNVLNPKDSGRGDNVVWVGTCEYCNERVFQRKGKKNWEHEVAVLGGKSITSLDCAKANEIIANKGKNDNIVEKDKTDSVINIGWVFNAADKFKNKANRKSTSEEFVSTEKEPSTNSLRCQGFTAQGTPCTSGVAPEYSNDYCHQHYKQGFN